MEVFRNVERSETSGLQTRSQRKDVGCYNIKEVRKSGTFRDFNYGL